MTKIEKRELLEFLISEAKKLSFKIKEIDQYCENKRKEKPDYPLIVKMEQGNEELKYRLAVYDRFIEKLSQELRA